MTTVAKIIVFLILSSILSFMIFKLTIVAVCLLGSTLLYSVILSWID